MIKQTLIAATALAAIQAVPAPALAEGEQFIPSLVYRTGPYGPNGEPWANALADYYTLINERDGGVGGVKITWEECDTQYNNDKGVECYERLKDKGPTGSAMMSPLSTGITYALLERATADKIPLFTMGYGRTDASDGRVFPYVFTMPATYWSQATALVKYIAEQEGGMESLDGKKIALIYHDSAYGKEPISTLEALAEEHGFDLGLYPVAPPGVEQKSTWLKIGRQFRPDWAMMWGWGVMNATAIQEAASVGFPMDRFIGNWWAGAEQDVRPAGDAAVGYKAANFSGVGQDFPVIQDILTTVYDAGNGAGERDRVGEVLYNRGLANAIITVEAIRTAQEMHGQEPLTGEQVRDGFENLDLTAERLDELGLKDFIEPISVTCADHEGSGPVFVQQWNGESWERISDWIEPMQDLVRPMIEESAAAYAAEAGIEPRTCPAS